MVGSRGSRERIEQSPVKRRRRGRWARVTTVVAFGALVFAFLDVQVFAFEYFANIAEANRLRPITLRAPRGTIYDRNGEVVAQNVVGHEVLLMPAPIDSMVATLVRLRPILGLSSERIRTVMEDYRKAPNRPVVVEHDASEGAVAKLAERQFLFPRVLVREYPKRYYPAGSAVAHVAGYVGEISEGQLEQPEFRDYRQGRWIGQAGLERSHELLLGGAPGYRYAEVDALGHIKQWLPETMNVPPIPGRDLELFLDIGLQRYLVHLFELTERRLGLRDMEAAFVAIDPQTGGVLALYSTPSFDPNVFVGGVQGPVWQSLTSDPGKPLLNRAAGMAQPPGSTFKLPVAATALRLGVITPEERMPSPCTGGLSYQNRYAKCWSVHGYQDLMGAIKRSCNVYFYQVGIQIGLEQFLETGSRLGFSSKTGVDLPAEIAPTFPLGLTWWKEYFGYSPNENEIMSLVIGQGAVTMTPVKLAQLYLPIAREDGRAPVPRIAKSDSLRFAFEYGVEPEHVRTLRRGMRRVLGPGGTAWLSRLDHWDFLGKTGTAQNPHGDAHAWFVGIGGPRGEPPEIVAAMVIINGLHGYVASGPVANAINFYLNRKYNRPFEPFGTPRIRLDRGMHVDWGWLISPIDDPPNPFAEDSVSAD